MSTVKDPSVKYNKDWGYNKPKVDPVAGKYAYLSPYIRELAVRCMTINEQLMALLNTMPLSDNAEMVSLQEKHPEILQRVIYDQDIYDNVINKLNT